MRPSDAGSVRPSSEKAIRISGLATDSQSTTAMARPRKSMRTRGGSSWCFLRIEVTDTIGEIIRVLRIRGLQKCSHGRELLPVADADHTCSRKRKPPDAKIAMARANSSSGAASGNTPSCFSSAKRSRPVFVPLQAAIR